jgi:hypothetical protein
MPSSWDLKIVVEVAGYGPGDFSHHDSSIITYGVNTPHSRLAMAVSLKPDGGLWVLR